MPKREDVFAPDCGLGISVSSLYDGEISASTFGAGTASTGFVAGGSAVIEATGTLKTLCPTS